MVVYALPSISTWFVKQLRLSIIALVSVFENSRLRTLKIHRPGKLFRLQGIFLHVLEHILPYLSNMCDDEL